MEAHLEAWTRLDADGRFHFEVVCSRGSSLIRSHVLVAALEAEQRSRSEGGHHRAAVTSDNYALTLGAARTGGLREVRLAPRRPSQLLIDGRVLVRSETGDMVRIEGRLSENPSWWTRRVDIVRRYERINGVRVPVEMTSTADVRVAGTSTFAMSYEYTAINGRRLTTRAHAGCSVGESG